MKRVESTMAEPSILARNRRKARLERRRDFLREVERASALSAEERLETALDLIDSLMELKEAAEHAQDE
jgi:hypothetical protein